jgi:Domain of unknown function (DUF4032)/Lipopolysaccharide kinase (Kdo/WaaP) family
VSFRLLTRPGHPTFLDLPLDEPMISWTHERLVSPVRGLHRHVVVFVAYGDDMYALKELPDKIAEREYRNLRELVERDVPTVDAIGTITGRTDHDGNPLEGIVITRHLDFSLPFRVLFNRTSLADGAPLLLDALAQLLVRIHLAGFYWGDCSLSNSLFRRDAGSLSATLVDAETGELHDRLSEGQRKYDLELAQFNVAAELADVAAEGGFEDAFDPAEIAQDLLDRYDALWNELTSTEVIPQGDKYAIEAKVRRINELGFDVSEITLEAVPGGFRIRFETAVVEADHHRRQLQALTGLDVQEGQARRLLNDVRGYRSHLERKEGKPISEARAAMRWLQEIFDPVISAVPQELCGKLEPAEIFHQVLEHRWFMSEALDKDIGTTIATQDYVDNVLRKLPEEYHAAADAEAELRKNSA